MTRSRLDGEPPHLRGIYIDLSGEGPAGMRLATVECYPGKTPDESGTIVMKPITDGSVNGDCQTASIIRYITAQDWFAFVEQLHGGERKTA